MMAELTEKFCQYFGRLGQKKKGLAELACPSWFWPRCLAIISSKTSPISTSGELTNGTTWFSAGEIESSSGQFTVETLSPEFSYMTNNMPSTSGGQKPEALPYADSQVEVTCVIEIQVSID
jgi:hypothetical protein